MTDVLLQIEYFTNIRCYVKLLYLYAQAVSGAIGAFRFGVEEIKELPRLVFYVLKILKIASGYGKFI